jgi:hypothetical protein
METLFAFLYQASTGIILFYLVYWIFLRNETFYNANRWFLMGALLFSIALPLFPLQYSVFVEPGKNTTVFQALTDTFKNARPFQPEGSETSAAPGWKNILLAVYITGAAIFLLRLFTQTFILIHLMIKYRIKSLNGIRIVENEKYGLPFSFMNLVFINPKFHTQADLPEILAHENVHIRGFHWFDLLFIELLTVIFWFNPFIWFFERSIKQNHEYLADKGVLAQGHSAGRYQALLVNQLMGMQIIGFTNNLNFALNTKRLKMMTKKKTPRILGVKFAWALPAVALLLFAFAEPVYKVKQAETENSIPSIQKGEKEFVIKGKVVREDNGKPLPGASVILKGTTIGTVAGDDGRFTLTDPNPKKDEQTGMLSSEVVASYVGFESAVLMVGASGTALENGTYTFKLAEGILYAHHKYSKSELPPPPPPPSQTAPPPPPVKGSENSEELFFIVEELPEYPGGADGLGREINAMQENLLKEKRITGQAKIAFTIAETGKITNVKIQEQDNDEVGNAAAGIVSKLKDWKPGSQRGTKVPVNFLIHIEF